MCFLRYFVNSFEAQLIFFVLALLANLPGTLCIYSRIYIGGTLRMMVLPTYVLLMREMLFLSLFIAGSASLSIRNSAPVRREEFHLEQLHLPAEQSRPCLLPPAARLRPLMEAQGTRTGQWKYCGIGF